MRRSVAPVMIAILLCVPVLGFCGGRGKVDPGRVRGELRQILSASEYDHTVKMNAFDRFLARIGQWVSDTLGSLGRWFLGHLSLGRSSLLATVACWIVVAAFIVGLAYVVWKLIASFGRKSKHDDDLATVDYDMPSARPMIKAAAKLAEQGDYRGAFRAAYVACIAYLDEIRALRFERSRTNWEYLRELKQAGHDRPYDEMHPLTLDFDRKIYGREDCHEEDYLSVAAAYQRLCSEEAK